MAQTFDTGIGGPLASPVGVQKPVVDESAVTALKSAGEFLDAFGERRKEKLKAEAAKLDSLELGDFSRQADAIGQAFHQGNLNKSEARVKLGQVYSSFVSGNVDMREDFSDLYTKIAKNYGISEGKTRRTAEDEQNIKTWEQAMQAGFISDFMSEDQKQAGFDAMRQMNAYRESLKIAQEQMTTTNARIDLNEKQRKLEEERITREVRNNLRGMSSSSYVRTENQTLGVMNRYRNNQTTEGRTAALAELAAIRSALRQDVFSAGGGRIPKEELELLMAAHEESLKLAEMAVRGEISDKVLEEELTRTKNQSQAEALSNPAINRAYGMVAVLGPNIISEKNSIELTAAYLADSEANGNVAPTPSSADTPAGRRSREGARIVQKSGTALARSVNSLPKGALRDTKLGEVQQIVSAQTAMLADKAFDIEKPSLMRDSIKFLGNSDLLPLFRSGELRVEDAQQVGSNITNTYLRSTERLMDNIINGDIRVGGNNVKVGSLFEASIDGGVLRYSVKPGLNLIRGPRSILGTADTRFNQPNTLGEGELNTIKADLDNLAKAYNDGVNAIYAISNVSSKEQVVEMLYGMGANPAGLNNDIPATEEIPVDEQIPLPGPPIDFDVIMNKSLEEITQQDIDALSGVELQALLQKHGIEPPMGG